MSMSTYPSGIDIAWIAVDEDNEVAVFITAGSGPIPKVLISQNDLDEMEDRILMLPPCSPVDLLVSVPRPQGFADLAARGLYIYDWQEPARAAGAVGQYELVARPHVPVNQEQFDQAIGHRSNCRLTGLCFARASSVDVASRVECLNAAAPHD